MQTVRTAGRSSRTDEALPNLENRTARAHFIRIVTEVLGKPSTIEDCAGRTGFCLAMYYPLRDGSWHVERRVVGTVADEAKKERYWRFAFEKCKRTRAAGHVSSRQSRNPALDHWAGGIKVAGGYVAISGLPEDIDEVGVVSAALCAGLISYEEAEGLLRQNPKEYLMLGLLDVVYGS